MEALTLIVSIQKCRGCTHIHFFHSANITNGHLATPNESTYIVTSQVMKTRLSTA